MANAKIIATACRQDPAAFIKSKRVVDLLTESNPGRRFIDYRELTNSVSAQSVKGLSGPLNLLGQKKIDIVIADASEIPLRLQPEFEIGAVPKRGNPFNVLISSEDVILEEQPAGVPIGVSDIASMGQLRYFRDDLLLVHVEGGYQVLSEMMISGEIGGFVINAAEVEAFGTQENVVEVFTSSICMPSAGKGAMGLIVRKGDRLIKGLVEEIDHGPSHAEIDIERIFLTELVKYGRKNVGVLGESEGDEFKISVALITSDGSEKLSATMRGSTGEEKTVARKLAAHLIQSGGKGLLETVCD
ncbi:MAG: hypothetical protein JW814_03525 [Candidatus Krumholzibacteriota bacterium]|nr:hypothetical protein [Candidatus Krumholzibacteriota bacterium]